MAEMYIEELLVDLDTKLEKHSNKKDTDPRGKKTVKYGLTKEGYNATMKYLKANRMINDPDFPKELKVAYKAYDMNKAYHVKGGEIQRSLTDLYTKGKQNAPVIKYVSTKFLESLEKRFDNNSNKTFRNLDIHEKKGLLSLAFQRPTSLMTNKRLMSGIENKNQEVIAFEMLNHKYEDDENKPGLQKRALMGVGYLFGYKIDDNIDLFLESNLKADPNFYANQMYCYDTVEKYRKCLQDANTLIPKDKRSEKAVAPKKPLEKTKDFHKPYNNEKNIFQKAGEWFNNVYSDIENSLNKIKERHFKDNFPKPFTNEEENNVNGKQDINLQ